MLTPVPESHSRRFTLNRMSGPIRRLWTQGWFRRAVCVAMPVVGILLLAAWHSGIWSLRDWEIYQAMNRECPPVWRDLHDGRVYLGQPVEEVIAQTAPTRVEHFENFVLLEYQENRPGTICFTNVAIVAKDGRLIDAQAGGCTWQRTVFAGWTEEERDSFWQRYWARK